MTAAEIEAMAKRGDKRRVKEKRRRPRGTEVRWIEVGPVRLEQHGKNIVTRVDPAHPSFPEWAKGRDRALAELPADIARLRAELQDELSAFDAFDVVADLWLGNVPKDRETYRESTEEGMSAIPELAAALMVARPSRNADSREWFGPHAGEINDKLRTLVMLEGFGMIGATDPAADPIYEEIRARARFHRLGVRGPSYSWQEEQTLRELCGEGEIGRELGQLLGFTVDEALAFAEAVTAVGVERFGERVEEARTFADGLIFLVDRLRRGDRVRLPEEKERQELVRVLAALPKKEADRRAHTAAIGWASYGSGTTLSFTGADVAKAASAGEEAAAAFLNRFSTPFGLELDPPRDVGVEDLRDRPILSDAAGRYLCSSPHNLLWAIRPAFETAARDAGGAVWARYEGHRRRVVERRAVAALREAVRADWAVGGVFYETEDEGLAKRLEIDGLVRVDTALFIVESKSAAMKPSARRGAPKSLREWLEREIGKAGMQVRRTRRALVDVDPTDRPPVTDEVGVPVPSVDLDGVEHAIELVVTLEDLPTIAPLTWGMADAGFLPADEPPIVISLHELEVICDVASRPCELVHYFLRRKRLNRQRRAYATDELDFFMHYLREGLYWDDPEDAAAGDGPEDASAPGPIQLLSFTDDLDAYYMYSRGERQTRARKPEKKHHRDVAEVLRLLDEHRSSGWLAMSLALLDFGVPTRERVAGDMRRLKRVAAQENRWTDRSYFGDGAGLTVMAFPAADARQLPDVLSHYCRLKKHQMRASSWVGFGVLVDAPELFQYAVAFTEPWVPDAELDSLVATMPSHGYDGTNFDGKRFSAAR